MADDILVPKQDRPCPDGYTEVNAQCSNADGTVATFPACLKAGHAMPAIKQCSAYDQVKLPGEAALQEKGAQTFTAMFPNCQGVTLQGLVVWLNQFPANQRQYVAFQTSRNQMNVCKVSDCALWDALELSLGTFLDRPAGCARSVEVSQAICKLGSCRLPGIGEIKCWWLYALVGAAAGGLGTWVVMRYRRYHKAAENRGRS